MTAATFCFSIILTATIPDSNSIPLMSNDRVWEAIHLKEVAHFAHLKTPVKIAVIDDGFDIDNPLWASHIAHNAGEIPGNEIDDDHNGKIDDYQGWDFGDNDEDTKPQKNLLDKESHGTRVLGVFWQTLQELASDDLSPVLILPIKAVSDKKMNNYLKEGYNGIAYAIEQKADIILCSWSGPMIAPEERALLEKARKAGIMVIAAAGNFYAMQPMYPGAVPSVMNVAALDRTGRKLHISNYGMFVDISAPGDSLLSYDPYQMTPTAYLSATSAATPVVAAVVAVIRSAYPGHSIADIERILKNTATPLEPDNPLYAGNLGSGMINVAGVKHQLENESATDAAAPDTSAFRQPKAFVDLDGLNKHQPTRIIPYGRYKNFKLFLPAASYEAFLTAPDIRVRCFRDGNSYDTVVRRLRLKYPLVMEGDSIHLFSLWERTPTHHKVWYYYEVATVDSSTLFCGGVTTAITGKQGILEDGSGDSSYTGRNDCKWQITVSPGKRIRINFTRFDTEPKLDQVYIFNGNSTKDPILAIFSGHNIPPSIKSWGNTVLIWFLTSEENNFGGWELHYNEED
ncbi:MAG: S8 family serine peptidase [Chitinophagaceae bacterium]|nr:S8 family serine peptidase [Chitinophagaceae bacterium]